MTARTTKPAVALTESGRPKLPKLDKKGIRETETAAVMTTLDSIEDDEARLKKSAQIIAEANGVISEYDGRLRKLGLSLALHDGARAVYDAMGMSRGAFYAMTERVLGDLVDVEVHHKDGSTTVEKQWKWVDRPTVWTPEVKARAKARRVLWHRNAATELPELGPRVFAARCRADAATKVRNELVRKLAVSSEVMEEIAAMIGRDRSRVYHIKGRATDDEAV